MELYLQSKCVNTSEELIVSSSRRDDVTLFKECHPFPLLPFGALPAAADVGLTQTGHL